MFWNNKFRLHEQIHKRFLKEPQYYIDDCGCRKEYEMVTIDLESKGDTYKLRTTLYRHIGDMITKAFQPVWDDKKIQAKFKKEREDEKKGIKKKEKKYVPTKYRKLVKQDYKDILLAYTLFYKWAKENLTEDYGIERILGTISAIKFAYDGVAYEMNSVHNNDCNTVDLIDLNIAQLTMSKKEFHNFYDTWADKKQAERDRKERDTMKGLVCHKCEVPMVEMEEKHAFDGKGHHLPAWLRGRKCPKCSFTIYLPKDVENYVEQNIQHYLIFPDKVIKDASPEMKEMIKEHNDSRKKFDDCWKHKGKHDDKILKSLREEKKTGKKSKYFGEMKGGDKHGI